MRYCLRVIFLVCAGACASGAIALELGVLSPVLKNGRPLQKADPQGQPALVVTQVRSGELHDQLQKEATEGFTSVVLALDVAAQRAAGATTPVPTWLYLSTEEGGFARRGFWLNEGKKQRFLSDPFVDLVVDAGSVRDGSFEEIFAHEMGHVFLRRLLPTLPHGYSRTAHSSFSITDDPTAFDEGFAIHFQGLARRLTRNSTLRDQDLGLEYKPLVSYWLSNLDRATRIEGMRRNWFVQAQIALPGTGDALARRDQSTLFDTARLKNGNQMLASEGVIATLFYRWLVPGSGERAAILERYSRLFAALSVVKGQHLGPDSPVFLDVLERYCQLFPEEAVRVLALVVDTTYGATADASVIAPIEDLASRGRIGDMQGFVAELQASRASLVQLRGAVLQSPPKLRGALGPGIWLWSGNRSVNLNTAELEELLQLPGVARAVAERALDSRRREGTFHDLADFGARAGIGAEGVAHLTTMAEAMQREGTYSRR
ncbi:MAG: ComEA family DNA-binding protein [Steroidobacteraceae bacterium]